MSSSDKNADNGQGPGQCDGSRDISYGPPEQTPSLLTISSDLRGANPFRRPDGPTRNSTANILESSGNQSSLSDASKYVIRSQNTPHVGNFSYGYAPVPSTSSNRDKATSWVPRIPPPPIPGRGTVMHNGWRDFISDSNSPGDRSPHNSPSSSRGGNPQRGSSGQKPRGSHGDRFPRGVPNRRQSKANTSGIGMTTRAAISRGYDLELGPHAEYTASKPGPNTPPSKGAAGRGQAETLRPPRTQNARKFGDTTRRPFSTGDLLNEDGSRRLPSITNREFVPLQPYIPKAIIMDDNYDIFNPYVMRQVMKLCRKSGLDNTPKAIATYHQVAMADDLFYSGVWKDRFMINQSTIIEYHNPGPSRPDTQGPERRDHRVVFVMSRKGSRDLWCKVIQGKILIPADEMELHPTDFVGVLNLWKYFFRRAPSYHEVNRYADLVAPQYVNHAEGADRANAERVGMTPGSDRNKAAFRMATEAEVSMIAALRTPDFIPAVGSDTTSSRPETSTNSLNTIDSGLTSSMPDTSHVPDTFDMASDFRITSTFGAGSVPTGTDMAPNDAYPEPIQVDHIDPSLATCLPGSFLAPTDVDIASGTANTFDVATAPPAGIDAALDATYPDPATLGPFSGLDDVAAADITSTFLDSNALADTAMASGDFSDPSFTSQLGGAAMLSGGMDIFPDDFNYDDLINTRFSPDTTPMMLDPLLAAATTTTTASDTPLATATTTTTTFDPSLTAPSNAPDAMDLDYVDSFCTQHLDILQDADTGALSIPPDNTGTAPGDEGFFSDLADLDQDTTSSSHFDSYSFNRVEELPDDAPDESTASAVKGEQDDAEKDESGDVQMSIE